MAKYLKILTLCLLVLNFSMPCVFAEVEGNFNTASDTIPVARDVSEGSNTEIIQSDIELNNTEIEDPEIEPINTNKVKKNVVPNPQTEGKKVIGLFVKTMIIMAFCAAIIYFALVFVKKFWASAFINQEFEELESLDLATPQNKQEALRSFLNRTK